MEGVCSRCDQPIACQAAWYHHVIAIQQRGRRSEVCNLTVTSLSRCTLFNARLVQPGAVEDGPVSDDEGGDGAAMLDDEDGPPVAVGAPEDAFTWEDIALLLEEVYGADFPYRRATPGATDVGENIGLQWPLSDVEKAVAQAARHLPDSERDSLLAALHSGCVPTSFLIDHKIFAEFFFERNIKILRRRPTA